MFTILQSPDSQPAGNQTPPNPPNNQGNGRPELADEVAELRRTNANIMEQLGQISSILGNAAANSRPAAPALPTNEEFAADQVGTIAKVVQAQIQPLMEFTVGMARANQITNITGILKKQFPDLEKFEDIFVGLIQNANPINHSVAISAYYMAKGKFLSTGGSNVDTTVVKTEEQNKPDPLVPAHLRPQASSSDTSSTSSTIKLRDLTELEERLRKEQGMTKVDYLFFGGEITEAQKEQLQPTKK